MTNKQKFLIGVMIFLLSNGIFLVNHSSNAEIPIDELTTCEDGFDLCISDCLDWIDPNTHFEELLECWDYCLNGCPDPEPTPTPNPAPTPSVEIPYNHDMIIQQRQNFINGINGQIRSIENTTIRNMLE